MSAPPPVVFEQPRSSEHRGSDDLLTAGLGLDGLRAMVPPAFADAEHPTAAELRRRALWSNWRGIADLAPGGGYGDALWQRGRGARTRVFARSRKCPALRSRTACWCRCPMRSTRPSAAWWSPHRRDRAASTARSRWPAPGDCRKAARSPIPTRARARIISTSMRGSACARTAPSVHWPTAWRSRRKCRTAPPASPSSTRIRRTIQKPIGAVTCSRRRSSRCALWTRHSRMPRPSPSRTRA